ncbi:ribonuclease activity regulator RraA [Brucella intermedia]|uniref:ribonuclease activity regulator RraA n=1 Tax=Brucella intermedia TaxID=94625 RepID=UPI00224AD91B|nr:ribonuclease activity regulator RraA [Brucella intermedia]
MTNATASSLSAATRDKLSRISAATIATQLFKRGIRRAFMVGVVPMTEDQKGFVGEAFTMRHIASREDVDTIESLRDPNNLQVVAVETIPPGHVLVIDSRYDTSAASMGDMLVTRLKVRGAAAVITDGAFRDGPVIAELGLPAYARASNANTRVTSFHVADLQTPISCAGVAVYPGDVLVGDREGVIVIPKDMADSIAEDGLEQEEMEAWIQKKILAGAPLPGTYPPPECVKEEYRRLKAESKL